MVIYTDASDWGWGAHVGNHATQGQWNSVQRLYHINVKELLAVFLALLYFQPIVKGSKVLIASDNTTVVAYLNNEGGTNP